MNSTRYIYDALYGKIYLDSVIWEIFTTPEVQRLREVRLCNINSLCLPGGANINRFEHALGTVYLAQQCLEDWPLITDDERKTFLLAALLHDSANAAFGHSVEYIEAQSGYSPEKDFANAVTGLSKKGKETSYIYRYTPQDSFFFGMGRELNNHLTENQINDISEIICGDGKFGALISGSVDLDNIDNVYRLAYHIGLINRTSTPIKLAKSIWTENNKLIVKDDAIAYLEEWYQVRRNLYLLLLENPEEFSAKCMLSEAIEIEKIMRPERTDRVLWNNTDYEVLNILKDIPPAEIDFVMSERYISSVHTPEELKEYIHTNYKQNYEFFDKNACVVKKDNTLIYYKITEGTLKETTKFSKTYYPKKIIERLMTGKLFPCLCILSTINVEYYNNFLIFRDKTNIEREINTTIESLKSKKLQLTLHPIKDVNKTERILTFTTESGKEISIGKPSHRLLIGVFIRNDSTDITKLDVDHQSFDQIKKDVHKFLSNKVNDPEMSFLPLHSEVTRLRNI